MFGGIAVIVGGDGREIDMKFMWLFFFPPFSMIALMFVIDGNGNSGFVKLRDIGIDHRLGEKKRGIDVIKLDCSLIDCYKGVSKFFFFFFFSKSSVGNDYWPHSFFFSMGTLWSTLFTF